MNIYKIILVIAIMLSAIFVYQYMITEEAGYIISMGITMLTGAALALIFKINER